MYFGHPCAGSPIPSAQEAGEGYADECQDLSRADPTKVNLATATVDGAEVATTTTTTTLAVSVEDAAKKGDVVALAEHLQAPWSQLLLSGFASTWMQGTSNSSVALTATVGPLEVTVRGPLGEATRLLQHLQLFDSGASSPPAVPASASSSCARPRLDLSFSPLRPSSSPPSPSSRQVPASQVPLQGRSAPVPQRSRRDVERDFPECPPAWLSQASSLGTANLTPRSRILRAWRAGCWARRVLAGEYAAPLPSEPLQLASRFYPVVGGGSTQPALYTSYRAFAAALGPLTSSPSVSHAFPSELESKVYVDAAGLAWPLPRQHFGVSRCDPCQTSQWAPVALPQGAIAQEELLAGHLAHMDDVIGPSFSVEAPALEFSGSTFAPLADCSLPAMLVDFSAPELLIAFDISRPDAIPDPAVMLQLALDWAQGEGSGERVQYYSVEEAPPEAATRKRAVLHVTREDAAQARVTTATLASQIQTFTDSLPALVKSVEDVAAMEKQLSAGPTAPLSGALGLGDRPKQGGQALSLLGPPPRTGRAHHAAPSLTVEPGPSLAEAEANEAEADFGSGQPRPDALSQAVLEQSKALTTLVAMQEELAAGRGSFFASVLQNMARRYWERFGGFALGAIARVAQILDCMQAGRTEQASDHAALLAVCLEQMSMDAGRSELGFQLTWLEDPPSAMFAARSNRTSLHTRAFAPLASQRKGQPTAPTGANQDEGEAANISSAGRKVGTWGPCFGTRVTFREWAAALPRPLLGPLPNVVLDSQALGLLFLLLLGRAADPSCSSLPHGLLWLPFVEPGCLLHGRDISHLDLPDFSLEDREENLKLAKLWSTRGQLGILPGPPPCSMRCRVFNSFKDLTRDRQIGDRRLPNASERHLTGPSCRLPPGFLLTALEVPRFRCAVTGYCSDRKDFYHQFGITEERAATNALAFDYPWAEVPEPSRLLKPRALLCDPTRPLCTWTPCFLSLFQGVEFALAAHEALLESCGALPGGSRLLNRAAFPLGDTVQALVIDDLVSLSVLPASAPSAGPSRARDLQAKADQAYTRHGVQGSPEKDVIGASPLQGHWHRDRLAELVLSSVLSPFAAADLTAEQSPCIYATDASLARGAICSCTVDGPVARSLWQNGDRRGAYTRLEEGPAALLKAAGVQPEDEDLGDGLAAVGRYLGGRVAGAAGVPTILSSFGSCPQPLTPALTRLAAGPRAELMHLDRRLLGDSLPGTVFCLGLGCDISLLAAFAATASQPPGAVLPLDPACGEVLGAELRRCFSRTLLTRCCSAPRPGIESICVNDLLASGRWEVEAVLPWRGNSHINVLELASVVALHRRLAIKSADSRVVILVDSQVDLTCFGLRYALKRSTSLQVAFGLYFSYGFAPTRLNIADDPTRFAPLRAPAGGKLHEALSLGAWHALSASRLRRPLASWVRLFLVVAAAAHFPLDFDSTLGYPGEGPELPFMLLSPSSPMGYFSPLPCAGSHSFGLVVEPPLSFAPLSCAGSCLWLAVEPFLLLPWTLALLHFPLDFDSTLGFPGEGWASLKFVVVGVAVAIATIAPSTPAELDRARRREPILLIADRVVRPVTRSNRAKLIAAFESWLLEHQGITLEAAFLSENAAERVAGLLVAYGQALFRAGQPYYKYSETINGEPHCHHKAMPVGILLALMAAALAWGYSALGKSLLLGDEGHQSARVDPSDIIHLADVILGPLPPSTMLWRQSAATFRRRLEQLQERVGLVSDGKAVFDLSSFRPGGATWMLGLTENSELVRRRGRWLSLRVMDIYLQEVVAITFLPALPAEVRARVEALAGDFTEILRRVTFFEQNSIPRSAWYYLLQGPRPSS
ncbi:unnamed protein product [Symbiodinium sp. CCMP2592]|nr:unnamed protein product [Symbiodinium sp. CCMP2592]